MKSNFIFYPDFNKLNKIILFLIFILIQNNLFSQKLKYSGYGATGFKVYEREPYIEMNQLVYYEGKIQAEVDINKNIEMQLDFRGNSEDNQVRLREFSVKFDYLKYLKFKVGNLKQPFGWEQLINRDEYYLVERSLLHENLSEIGYTERSVGIQAYNKYNPNKDSLPLSYYFMLFRDNSQHWGFTTRLTYHTSLFDYSLGYIRYYFSREGSIGTNGFSADLTFTKNRFLSNLEFFYTGELNEMRRLKSLDINEDVYSFGTKILFLYSFNINNFIIEKIEPIYSFAFYTPKTDDFNYHQLQNILGINFYFHKDVRLRLNGDLRLVKNKFQNEYSNLNSHFIIELQARF